MGNFTQTVAGSSRIAQVSSLFPCSSMFVPRDGQCDEAARRLRQDIERLGRIRTFRAGETIVNEGEPMDFAGRVASGVLRLQSTMSDGRQQIVGLLFPPDTFGRVFSGTGRFAIEAATDASICSFERRQLEALLSEHPELEHQMLLAALDQLDRTRDWILILGAPSVQGRLAGFLLLLNRRQDAQSAGLVRIGNPDLVRIPICRRDVAACLGTTVESLCRTFGRMEEEKVIRKLGRNQIAIVDKQKLMDMFG